jgi:hypothetical protein
MNCSLGFEEGTAKNVREKGLKPLFIANDILPMAYFCLQKSDS